MTLRELNRPTGLRPVDRRRMLPEGGRMTDAMGQNTVLVDGVVAGTWVYTGDDVEVTPWRRLPREAETERVRLRDWLRTANRSPGTSSTSRA